MKDLRFIDIHLVKYDHWSNIVEFDKVSEYLPRSLRFMRWYWFPFSSLPNTFQGRHLVELDISFSKIVKLWEDGEGKVLHKLRFLKIMDSKLRTFDLRLAPNLEQLTISCCDDFEELHIPADHHSKLEYLFISYSKLLTNFHLGNTPNLKNLTLLGCIVLVELHLGNTSNLKTLILEGCHDLVEFQMPAESLNLEHLDLRHLKLTNLHLENTPNLKKLKLSHSKLKTIHLGNTPNLEKLKLKGCIDLVELQMPDEILNLQYLYLTHSKLTNLHLENTPNLKKLKLSHSKLKTLHLGNTPNLESLRLKGCNDLVELQMPIESPKLEDINLTHSKLRTLDLGLTPNLEWLYLKNCYDLVEINAPIGCLKKLLFLDLSGCGNFKSFVFDKWYEPAEADSLSELHLIAEPTDVCPLHCNNDSPKFKFSCYLKGDQASSFGNLKMLISMGLCACTNLENFSRSICSLQGLRKLTLGGSIPEVPKDLDQLEYLEELILSSTEIKYLPDSICKLKHLKSFKIKSCWLLEKLPEDIGRLESLEKLILTDCKLLQDIPNSICKMKCINELHLRGCTRVVELPEDIGCLEGLKELNIAGTGIIRLPQSIFRLRGLRIVGSIRLIDTCGLLLKRRRTYDDDEIVCCI